MTTKTRQRIVDKSAGHCWYCGLHLPRFWQVSHVIPLDKGGKDDLDNAVPACKACCSFKHKSTLEDFRHELTKQYERGVQKSINMRNCIKFNNIKFITTEIIFWFEKQPELRRTDHGKEESGEESN